MYIDVGYTEKNDGITCVVESLGVVAVVSRQRAPPLKSYARARHRAKQAREPCQEEDRMGLNSPRKRLGRGVLSLFCVWRNIDFEEKFAFFVFFIDSCIFVYSFFFSILNAKSSKH